MDKFLDFVLDNFGVIVMTAFAAGFIYGLFSVGASQNEAAKKHRAETQRLTEACYSQGMVLIDTDAGQRCADPRSLVKVK